MSVRLNIVTLLAFSALFACAACGGTTKTGSEAKGPEANPWADYKGTYATAGTGSGSSSSASKNAKTEVAAAEAPKSEEPAAAPAAAPAEEAPAPAPVTPPPAKKGKTAGKGAKKKK